MAGYTICYRRGDGQVETEDRDSLASVMGVLGHLTHDYSEIWVRQKPGGAIVLVYDADGGLDRP